MKSHEPRSSSSCAACKFLKRRCTPNCIFAPYFRSDESKKFAKVHKVFGASNVSKILMEVPEEQREDTVNSLAYEAEARLRDPVYGCIGAIALLQRKMVELQHELAIARARLSRYAAVASSSSTPPSLSSSTVLDDRIGMAPFPDAFSCNGLSYSFSQSPSDLSRYGPVNDLGQIPYVL
ncbi:LOB domain-containing protein 21 [Quercus suber]|uniref:Lob domain-containing protein 21 n=1 Tax=Quercus suber TaxID=58331 RepID=A0AAW0JJW0_QUESU|nr:LOB domain-containing protein 21 [Quercus suber]POE46073.1 lob domain-containing protein 21 [Quercus suber]